MEPIFYYLLLIGIVWVIFVGTVLRPKCSVEIQIEIARHNAETYSRKLHEKKGAQSW